MIIYCVIGYYIDSLESQLQSVWSSKEKAVKELKAFEEDQGDFAEFKIVEYVLDEGTYV